MKKVIMLDVKQNPELEVVGTFKFSDNSYSISCKEAYAPLNITGKSADGKEFYVIFTTTYGQMVALSCSETDYNSLKNNLKTIIVDL